MEEKKQILKIFFILLCLFAFFGNPPWFIKNKVLTKKYNNIDDEFWLVKILDKYINILEDNYYFLE